MIILIPNHFNTVKSIRGFQHFQGAVAEWNITQQACPPVFFFLKHGQFFTKTKPLCMDGLEADEPPLCF